MCLPCWHLLEHGEGEGIYNLLLISYDGCLRHYLKMQEAKMGLGKVSPACLHYDSDARI